MEKSLAYDLLDAWTQLNHWQICCQSKSLKRWPDWSL